MTTDMMITMPLPPSDGLDIASQWDAIGHIEPDEPFTSSSAVDVNDVLEEWTSDEEDSDLNLMDVDEQIGTNLFADSIFGDEPAVPPPSQLDSMHLDLEGDDYFMNCPSPVATEDFPFVDNKYKDAYYKLAESMRRSEATHASLKLQGPIPLRKYEERRKNISNVLSSIENSSKQIHTLFPHHAVQV